MDTPQESFPGLRIIALCVRILGLQRNVGRDVNRGIAGIFVLVSGRQGCGINVQKIEHGCDGDLGVKFFKHQNRLGMVGIEPDSVSAAVISDAADILYLMLLKNAPGFTGTGYSEQIVHFQFPELTAERFAFQVVP